MIFGCSGRHISLEKGHRAFGRCALGDTQQSRGGALSSSLTFQRAVPVFTSGLISDFDASCIKLLLYPILRVRDNVRPCRFINHVDTKRRCLFQL